MEESLYLGKKLKEKHFVKAKAEIIHPDEKISCIIKGRLTRGIKRKGPHKQPSYPGLLFITDKRVIFYVKSLFGRSEQLVFPYEQINSVYSLKGLTADKIDISAMGDQVSIDWIPKGDGKIATERINNMLKKSKGQAPMPTISPQIDITDQIDKLGKLREKGLITEEEFERKKGELLEKL